MAAQAPALFFGQILSHLISVTYQTSLTGIPPPSPHHFRSSYTVEEECWFQTCLSIHLHKTYWKITLFMLSSIQILSSLLTLLQWKKITTFWKKISWNLFAGKHLSFPVPSIHELQSMLWVILMKHDLFSGLGFNGTQLLLINVINLELYPYVKCLMIYLLTGIWFEEHSHSCFSYLNLNKSCFDKRLWI